MQCFVIRRPDFEEYQRIQDEQIIIYRQLDLFDHFGISLGLVHMFFLGQKPQDAIKDYPVHDQGRLMFNIEHVCTHAATAQRYSAPKIN